MQAKLDDLVRESQRVGLRVNISKTKDLRVNSRTTEAFRIGEEAIERVDDFLYLGRWTEIITNQELWERTEQSDINVEIKRRKYG
jgi:hypothetical protein